MSKKKKVMIVITIILILILLITDGWRLLGFKGCSSPNMPGFTEIKVTDNMVKLKAIVYTSSDFFSGYITKFEDKNLYIGVKYKLITLPRRNGGLDIRIPTNGMDIEKIYIKGPDTERLIWEKGIGIVD